MPYTTLQPGMRSPVVVGGLRGKQCGWLGMVSPSSAFFEDLADRGHVPWLEHERGRLRVEIVDEDCVRLWTVAFEDGQVRVDHDESDADGVLRAERAWFDRAVTGEERFMPAG